MEAEERGLYAGRLCWCILPVHRGRERACTLTHAWTHLAFLEHVYLYACAYFCLCVCVSLSVHAFTPLGNVCVRLCVCWRARHCATADDEGSGLGEGHIG